jgi:hypothetical protein
VRTDARRCVASVGWRSSSRREEPDPCIPTRPDGRPGASALGYLEEFQRQAGFADTRLTGNEHEPAEAGERLVKGPGQPAQRLLAADGVRSAHEGNYRRSRSRGARVPN